MIDKYTKERIAKRAYEIFEWRKENNLPGSSLGDWLEAESEILNDRRTKNCPKCGFSLLARENNEIICLKCDWRTEAKRDIDKVVPRVEEIRKDWG